jgi:hypothetical protein
MNHCNKCKDWIRLEHKTTEGVIVGDCLSDKLTISYHDTLTDGASISACGVSASMVTGENFCCINFRGTGKQKEYSKNNYFFEL